MLRISVNGKMDQKTSKLYEIKNECDQLRGAINTVRKIGDDQWVKVGTNKPKSNEAVSVLQLTLIFVVFILLGWQLYK